MNARTHLIVGGFPPGGSAGHGMDYARRWRGMWPCPYPGPVGRAGTKTRGDRVVMTNRLAWVRST